MPTPPPPITTTAGSTRVAVRPLAKLGSDVFAGGDCPYQARFPRGLNPITQRAEDPAVFQLAPMLVYSPMGPSAYDRPQLRFVYRAAHLNDGARDLYVPDDPRRADDVGPLPRRPGRVVVQLVDLPLVRPAAIRRLAAAVLTVNLVLALDKPRATPAKLGHRVVGRLRLNAADPRARTRLACRCFPTIRSRPTTAPCCRHARTSCVTRGCRRR